MTDGKSIENGVTLKCVGKALRKRNFIHKETKIGLQTCDTNIQIRMFCLYFLSNAYGLKYKEL